MPDTTIATRSVSNTYAWSFALAPLPIVITFVLLDRSGWDTSSLSVPVNLGIYAGLRQVDVTEIRKAGDFRVPSRWWISMPPGYLWQRATFLGQPRTQFWVHIAAILVAAGIGVVANPTLLSYVTGRPVLASCGEATSTVISLFNGMDAVKRASVVGVSLDGVRETSLTDAERSCAASIVDKSGKRYNAQYTVSFTDKGQNYVQLSVK